MDPEPGTRSWNRKAAGATRSPPSSRISSTNATPLYLGTASAGGQPYIQHRGGPKGFIKVLGNKTLAFADFSGNRQYISVGNLDENDRALVFHLEAWDVNCPQHITPRCTEDEIALWPALVNQ